MSALTDRMVAEHRQSSRYNGGIRLRTCTCGWEHDAASRTGPNVAWGRHMAEVTERTVREQIVHDLASAEAEERADLEIEKRPWIDGGRPHRAMMHATRADAFADAARIVLPALAELSGGDDR